MKKLTIIFTLILTIQLIAGEPRVYLTTPSQYAKKSLKLQRDVQYRGMQPTNITLKSTSFRMWIGKDCEISPNQTPYLFTDDLDRKFLFVKPIYNDQLNRDILVSFASGEPFSSAIKSSPTHADSARYRIVSAQKKNNESFNNVLIRRIEEIKSSPTESECIDYYRTQVRLLLEEINPELKSHPIMSYSLAFGLGSEFYYGDTFIKELNSMGYLWPGTLEEVDALEVYGQFKLCDISAFNGEIYKFNKYYSPLCKIIDDRDDLSSESKSILKLHMAKESLNDLGEGICLLREADEKFPTLRKVAESAPEEAIQTRLKPRLRKYFYKFNILENTIEPIK